jgi:hypothetical protein
MGVLDELKYLNYKRKNFSKIYEKFREGFLMSNSKKIRRPINNSDHWTSSFFRFRGTLTAPEQTIGILDWIFNRMFQTRDQFLDVVTDKSLWTVVGVFSYLAMAIFVGDFVDENKKKKKF